VEKADDTLRLEIDQECNLIGYIGKPRALPSLANFTYLRQIKLVNQKIDGK